MSFQAKPERAAKKKAAEAIKRLAETSNRRVLKQGDVNVETVEERYEEIIEESKEEDTLNSRLFVRTIIPEYNEFEEEEDVEDEEELQREEFAVYCRENWREMDGMACCTNCFKGIGYFEEKCEYCGDIMECLRFGECGGGCIGVQGFPGICPDCESSCVEPFGG